MTDDAITTLLACPRCRGTLRPGPDLLHCNACQHQMPIVGGVPWVQAYPEAQLAAWRQRYNYFLQSLNAEAAELKALLQAPIALPSTAERLRRVLQAKVEHGKTVQKLLEPLGVEGNRPIELSIAAQTKLPETQQLMSYYANICRDWGSEGEAENELCLQIALGVLPAEFRPKSILVLGTGASRLPADLHTALMPRHTLALDINPFLLLAARRILRGHNLSLYEFPLAPRDPQSAAVVRKCRRLAGAIDSGFHLMQGDGLNAPVQPASFDLVVTPWFVDIIPEEFATFVQRINQMLAPGGIWLNFGSLAFIHKAPSHCYSRTEALELVDSHGFRLIAKREDKVPYLRSSLSVQERTEEILCFAAAKTGSCAAPAVFKSLPPWLSDFSLPVPALAEFAQLVVVNRLYAEMLARVDGQASIAGLAQGVGVELNLTADDAAALLQTLLTQAFENARRSQRI